MKRLSIKFVMLIMLWCTLGVSVVFASSETVVLETDIFGNVIDWNADDIGGEEGSGLTPEEIAWLESSAEEQESLDAETIAENTVETTQVQEVTSKEIETSLQIQVSEEYFSSEVEFTETQLESEKDLQKNSSSSLVPRLIYLAFMASISIITYFLCKKIGVDERIKIICLIVYLIIAIIGVMLIGSKKSGIIPDNVNIVYQTEEGETEPTMFERQIVPREASLQFKPTESHSVEDITKESVQKTVEVVGRLTWDVDFRRLACDVLSKKDVPDGYVDKALIRLANADGYGYQDAISIDVDYSYGSPELRLVKIIYTYEDGSIESAIYEFIIEDAMMMDIQYVDELN